MKTVKDWPSRFSTQE